MKKTLLLLILLTLCVLSNGIHAQLPVDPHQVPEIMQKFRDGTAERFAKKGITLGRLPNHSEIGTDLYTFVSDDNDGYKIETTNTISADHVIARNEQPVADGIYNEWLVPAEKWKELYGKPPESEQFAPFKRIATIKAIKIDETILTLLGSTDNESATIYVSWSEDGMKVYKNGYLTEAGYGIAPKEMEETYEPVQPDSQ